MLADAGVIDLRDRARSTVAAGGPAAARRLLSGQLALRLAGSDDPALDIALRTAGGSVVMVGERGSFQGLTRLWHGTATPRPSTFRTAPALPASRSPKPSCGTGSRS